MRVLGKGLTAQAIKEKYPEASWYDDSDVDSFDKDCDEITIVSPGIPPNNYLVQNSKNLISEYDLLIPKDKFTIWISGTNGKTTTTAMCEHILKQYGAICGGNIGTPLARLDEKAPLWILESSSFTLHYTNRVKPNIYLLLPISDDHVSWHGTFEAYESAKLKPLSIMDSNDIAIVPSRYKHLETNAYTIYYDSSEDLAKHFEIDCEQLNFNDPFLFDAIMAMASEKILFDTIDYNKMNSFTRAQHTLEEFRDSKNRVWVNDSKGTNVDASIQAINSYKDKEIHLIIGGDDKGADLTPFFEAMDDKNIQLYLIGTNIDKTFRLSEEYNIPYNICETLETCVKIIDEKYTHNNIIGILSPAASSLDQFPSYKKRGEIFKDFVKSL
jgi:UDP-N-acetylmuramoylalanine--D-glutamate ligase